MPVFDRCLGSGVPSRRSRSVMSDCELPDWFDTLATSYTVEILEIANQPRSAGELSDELDAPIATVYRRVDTLVDCGLLELDGNRLSDDGRREKTYRRTIDGLSIEFTPEAVVVDTDEFSEARAALADTWGALRNHS